MEIDKDIPNILDLLSKNIVLKIVAPSGSGKTTNLPRYLGKIYTVNVVVSDVKIANSLNNFKFKNVQYFSYSNYITHLIKKDIPFPQVLIVDENDNFSIESYFVVSLWKNQNENNSRLVLTSNLPLEIFPQYPTYVVERLIPTIDEIRYLGDYDDDSQLLTSLVGLIYESNQLFSKDKAFLVFAPHGKFGKEVKERLAPLMDEDIVLIYKKDVNKNIDVVYSNGNNVKRKIVISDDLAKTSISFSNFSLIFDTMKSRFLVPTVTGGCLYKDDYISKRDAVLRSRRSNINSITYRFISEDKFDSLKDYTEEYVFRVPLHHLIIDLYGLGLNPHGILFNFSFEDINFNMELFVKYGIIDANFKVTEMGKTIRKWPFGLRNSIFLYNNMSYASLLWVSVLENYGDNIFLYGKDIPNSKGVNDYTFDRINKIGLYFNRFRGDSDMETFLYLFTILLEETDYMTSKNREISKNWAIENYISEEYVSNVLNSIEKMLPVLNLSHSTFIVRDFISSVDNSVKTLYDDKRCILNLGKDILCQYFGKDGIVYDMNPNSINTIEEKRPMNIYNLISSSMNNTENTIDVSYVSPDVPEEKFPEPEEIIVLGNDVELL